MEDFFFFYVIGFLRYYIWNNKVFLVGVFLFFRYVNFIDYRLKDLLNFEICLVRFY